MAPTVFGLLVLAVGLYLMRKPPSALLALVIIVSLFGGTAAAYVTALGGNTVTPAAVALCLLLMRLPFSSYMSFGRVGAALAATAPLVAFGAYGVAAALVFPHLFHGEIDVTPQTGRVVASARRLLATQPLAFTPQNITQAAYIAATALAAVAAYVIARRERCTELLVKCFVVVAWVHVGFGVIDVVSDALGLDVLSVFRNASYAQLDQSVSGFHRIAGVFPEASVYAAFGFLFFVANFELWLRDIKSSATGPAALALFLALMAATSSTAYVAMTAYGAIVILRLTLLAGGARRLRKAQVLLIAVMSMVAAGGAVCFLAPNFAQVVGDMLHNLTFEKLDSASGEQRMFWAAQGWHAFLFSLGFGIGPGSFRSSSLATAIMGTMGVFGCITFLLYILRVLPLLRRSTFALSLSEERAVAESLAWAVIAGLLPALVAASSPDPGALFGLFSGCVLALRAASRPRAERPALTYNGAIGHASAGAPPLAGVSSR